MVAVIDIDLYNSHVIRVIEISYFDKFLKNEVSI